MDTFLHAINSNRFLSHNFDLTKPEAYLGPCQKYIVELFIKIAVFILSRTQRPYELFVFNLIYIDSVKSRK